MPDFSSLTPRERDCLLALSDLEDAKSVARQLGLSPHTVNNHLQSAMRKLEVRKSERAARLYAEHVRAPSEESSGELSLVDRDPTSLPPTLQRPGGSGADSSDQWLLREERAVFAFDQQPAASSSLPWPLRRGGETANRLSTYQRLSAIFGLALAIGLLALLVIAAGSVLSTYRRHDFGISSS